MALERNNQAADFEMMLRRHLTAGGGPQAACTGFDADSASAYLEGGLDRASQNHFESHLAGCTTCRRHVIELSRLSRPLPGDNTHQPSVADGRLRWVEWKSVLAEKIDGFKDVASWRWNWRLAGSALAAGLAVMAILVVKPWNVLYDRASETAATQAMPAASVNQPLSSIAATPEIEATAIAQSDAAGNIGHPASRTQPVPAPQVSLVSGQNSRAIERFMSRVPSGTTIQKELISSGETARQDIVAPPAIRSNYPATGVSRTEMQAGLAERPVPIRMTSEAPPSPPEAQVEPEIATRITASPEDNPMHGARRSNARNRSPRSILTSRPGWYDRVMGFLPQQAPEKEEKPSEESNDETLNQLTRRMHGKTFRFEQGVWIDQAYKPQFMEWRVKRIKINSPDYQQLLRQEPGLREFFDLGQVIIVWGDKIYRVVNP